MTTQQRPINVGHSVVNKSTFTIPVQKAVAAGTEPVGNESVDLASMDLGMELTHRHFGMAKEHPVALRHSKDGADPYHKDEDKLVDEYRDLFGKARTGMSTAQDLQRCNEIKAELSKINQRRINEAQGIIGKQAVSGTPQTEAGMSSVGQGSAATSSPSAPPMTASKGGMGDTTEGMVHPMTDVGGGSKQVNMHRDASGSTAHHHGKTKEEDVLHPDHYTDPRDRHEDVDDESFESGFPAWAADEAGGHMGAVERWDMARDAWRKAAGRASQEQQQAFIQASKSGDFKTMGKVIQQINGLHTQGREPSLDKTVSALTKALLALAADDDDEEGGFKVEEDDLADVGFDKEPTLKEKVAYGDDEVDSDGVIPTNDGPADAVDRDDDVYDDSYEDEDGVDVFEPDNVETGAFYKATVLQGGRTAIPFAQAPILKADDDDEEPMPEKSSEEDASSANAILAELTKAGVPTVRGQDQPPGPTAPELHGQRIGPGGKKIQINYPGRPQAKDEMSDEEYRKRYGHGRQKTVDLHEDSHGSTAHHHGGGPDRSNYSEPDPAGMKNWMSEHDLDHVDPNVLGERQVDSIVEQLSSEFHLPENEARDFWFSQWSGTDDPAHDDQGRSVGGESDPGFHDEKGNLLGFEDDQGGDEGYNPGGNRALEHDLDDAEEYEDPMASPESLDPEHKAIVKSLGLLPGPMPAVGWGQQRPISEE